MSIAGKIASLNGLSTLHSSDAKLINALRSKPDQLPFRYGHCLQSDRAVAQFDSIIAATSKVENVDSEIAIARSVVASRLTELSNLTDEYENAETSEIKAKHLGRLLFMQDKLLEAAKAVTNLCDKSIRMQASGRTAVAAGVTQAMFQEMAANVARTVAQSGDETLQESILTTLVQTHQDSLTVQPAKRSADDILQEMLASVPLSPDQGAKLG